MNWNSSYRIPPQVILVIGPSSSGKTTLVKQQYPSAYWKCGYDTWWDGYDGVSDIVLDDFDGWLSLYTFLHLIDCLPIRLLCLASFVEANPSRIYIISSGRPECWYTSYLGLDASCIYRRISSILIFDETFGYTAVDVNSFGSGSVVSS